MSHPAAFSTHRASKKSRQMVFLTHRAAKKSRSTWLWTHRAAKKGRSTWFSTHRAGLLRRRELRMPALGPVERLVIELAADLPQQRKHALAQSRRQIIDPRRPAGA